MDYELWMRIARKSEIGYIKTYLANSRCHDSAKTTLYWKDIGIKECMLASLKNHGTVSNMMICDFINLNYEKEIEWIIKQLKFFEIFGPGPKIKNINLLNGNEVHNCSNISMKVESNEPLYALLIKGKDIDLGTNELNIYLNEKLIKEYFIKESSFTFIILIPCQNSDCNIKIVQRSTSASRIHQLNTKREQVLVSDYIIPLSEPEYEFTQMMYKNIKFIGKWLKENRKVNPFDY
ncbi:hypothetical protein F6Y03_01665 [Bacillus megaterium]|nr:hypothetical protein [Priestia megaterium]